MADYYFDSSALVKRYVNEMGSTWVSGLFDPSLRHEAFIAAITPVEIVAAIARRARGRTIAQVDAVAACTQFRADLQTSYQVVELTDVLLAHAMSLAETHALRGYDAVQLAAALAVNALCVENDLPPLIFVSADGELNTVAADMGLAIDNPNDHHVTEARVLAESLASYEGEGE
ncbi:MAG: type II toxin-antitoxin system VapC family toxin [Anaerolineae bacterium]|nr:type II toxin-antitoxin system VapC family toxin [Anaerolineae bacterium]